MADPQEQTPSIFEPGYKPQPAPAQATSDDGGIFKPRTSTEKPTGPISNPDFNTTAWWAPTAQGLLNIEQGVEHAAEGTYNLIRHPVDTAKGVAALPSAVAQVPSAIHDISESPDAGQRFLKVAGDTAGEGAGQAIFAVAAPSVVKGVKGAVPGAVRVGARIAEGVANKPLIKTALTAAMPADEAAAVERIRVPGRDFGIKQPAATPEAAPEPSPTIKAAEPTPAIQTPTPEPPSPPPIDPAKLIKPLAKLPPSLRDAIGQQLSKALGAQELKPDVPLREQLPASQMPEPQANVPEGHTAVDSSALQSHMYDPATNELHVNSAGKTHVYGEVTPEEADQFAQASSKGKAWNAIKKSHPYVAKIQNGTRMPVTPER